MYPESELIKNNKYKAVSYPEITLKEKTVTVSVLILCIIGYLTVWSLLRYFSIDLPAWVMNQIVQIFSLIFFAIVFSVNKYSVKDAGLRIGNVRKTIIPDVIIAFTGAIALILIKVILMRVYPDFFPENAPFWDWSVATPADYVYPLTVILQEFLAFGVLKDSLKKVFSKKYADLLSLIFSSAVFGILHIAYGPVYMIASVMLVGVLGILYQKQNSIWGLCIIHYVIGETATFLRYIV